MEFIKNGSLMKAFENRANELYINLRLRYEKNNFFS